MTVLLGPIDGELELDDSEAQALDALADGGLVPPLRMVPMIDPRHVEPAESRPLHNRSFPRSLHHRR